MSDLESAVFSASSLDELRDALVALSDFDEEYGDGCRDIDLTSLPTFSTAEIDDTYGVFSWNDTRQLVYQPGWRIEPRKDLD